MKKQEERTGSEDGMTDTALKAQREGVSRGDTSASPAAIPWQQRPAGSEELVWRHSGNPVIGRDFAPSVQGIYNSAVVPYGDGFAGVFRYEDKRRYPRLHSGWSEDGLQWHIEPQPITFSGDPKVIGKDDYAWSSPIWVTRKP